MNDRDLQRAELLSRRLSAVAEASALNAETLRLTQKLAGLEMELLHLELELDLHPDDSELAEAMAVARGQVAVLDQEQNECTDLYRLREQDIAEIDRQLAAAMAGLAGG